MSEIGRRQFLKIGGALAGAAIVPRAAAAQEWASDYDDAYAVLYDATRCIGCRSCARACRAANDLKPDRGEINGVGFDMPHELSHQNLMALQLYRDENPPHDEKPRWSYIKRNCMHCNLPACASACPVAALKKTDGGPVVYFEDRCIGCRYCMLACPYNVPKYEWLDRSPRVRKCNLNGACVRACPVAALVDGNRGDLIRDAHQRIDRHPARYVSHVYGEYEGGGTSYLILSAIPLEKMGFPALPATASGHYAEPILRTVPGWVAGLALFLGALHQLRRGERPAAGTGEGAVVRPEGNQSEAAINTSTHSSATGVENKP